MKTRLFAARFIPAIACAACLVMTASAARAQTYHQWSQRFGTTGSDIGNSVAVDASGNVIVIGNFEGTVNFGGSNLVAAGGTDIFLAKYNAAGVHQWSQRFGGTGPDWGSSVAVDASGNVFVTGSFEFTVNFGGGNLVSEAFGDIFLAKYNAAGVHQWSQRFGSVQADRGNSVAVDASGNVVVTGFFLAVVDFGGGHFVSWYADVFVAKYNAAGLHQWSRFFTGPGDAFVSSVAVDASGNVFVTGDFISFADFGGGDIASAGGWDIFLAKYNAAGVHQWSQRFGGDLNDLGRSVAVDASGNVFVTGNFRAVVNFGGGNLSSVGGDPDIFIAKYDAAGAHQWSRRSGGTGNDEGYSLAVDPSGDVFVTGSFTGTVNFGGSNLVGAGATDIFVARYNASGVHQWSQRFGSTGADRGSSVAVDASGNVLATGFFVGTADFGGGNLVGAGSNDVFVAKFAGLPFEPVISTITDVGNDQGRQVNIRFDRSVHDKAAAATQIVSYEAYRRDDPPPAAYVAGENPASRRELLDVGWTFAGEVPAHGQVSYGLEAPTIGDSTVALGPYNSTFFIRGATSDPLVYFDSPSAAGYSLDNLAPPAPLNLELETGDLSWDESTTADFDFFTVYGANILGFGSATLVDYSVAAAMDVNASPYVFYYVTATDFAGNEGKPAVVSTLSGVGGTPKSYVLSVSNYPNPFNPRTTVNYTIPSRGSVTVSVYDARGARIATLFSGERAAGAYSIEWDGRTDGAAVAASGVYFARIEHSSGTRSKKMLLLK